jgi:hypothetical protein
MLKKIVKPEKETRDEPLKEAQKPDPFHARDNLIHGALLSEKCTLVPWLFKKWPNEHIPSFDLPVG